MRLDSQGWKRGSSMKVVKKSGEVLGQLLRLIAGDKFDSPVSKILGEYPTIPY